MTGWRIGYTQALKICNQGDDKYIQSQLNMSNPTSLRRRRLLEALTGPQDFIKTMLAEFDKRRKYLVSELDAHPAWHAQRGAHFNTSKLYGKQAGRKK